MVNADVIRKGNNGRYRSRCRSERVMDEERGVMEARGRWEGSGREGSGRITCAILEGERCATAGI